MGGNSRILYRDVTELSDCELLTELLGGALASGVDRQDMSQRLLTHYDNSLSAMANDATTYMRDVENLGLQGARRVAVAIEWGKRCTEALERDQIFVHTSRDIIALFNTIFDDTLNEECWAVYLATNGRILELQRISHGGAKATVVDHRLIIKRALELLSTNIVLVHNHPEPVVEPSYEDKEMTRKLLESAKFFDIELMDHVIMSPGYEAFSFFVAGLIKHQ